MEKEKLTFNNIKKDILSKINKYYISLFFVLLLFGIYLALSFFVVSLLKVYTIFLVVIFFLPLLLLIYAIVIIFDIIKLYIMLSKELCIVKDKLVGLETRLHSHGLFKYIYISYHCDYFLNFSSYGKYILFRGDYYKWSTKYNMSDKSVYNSSSVDDEFYLVLTKKHTGKISLAYNTKMFELQE